MLHRAKGDGHHWSNSPNRCTKQGGGQSFDFAGGSDERTLLFHFALTNRRCVKLGLNSLEFSFLRELGGVFVGARWVSVGERSSRRAPSKEPIALCREGARRGVKRGDCAAPMSVRNDVATMGRKEGERAEADA